MLQSVVSLFFSYAHPTDAAIKDEGKGKLEVSHPNYLEQ